MFPLAHNYMVDQLIKRQAGPFGRDFSPLQRQLLYVGSILPDFVGGMGLNRDEWHSGGAALLRCARALPPANRAEGEAIALGAWLHGDDGWGFDSYADEVWQGKMGWCFLKCLPYIPDAVLVCNLPRKFALWKAHNLVELAAELELAAAQPEIGPRLLAAVGQEPVLNAVGQLMVAYTGSEPPAMRRVLQTIDQRFAVVNTNATNCARLYLEQLERRHQITGGSVAGLAQLLEQIRGELRQEMWSWFEQVTQILSEKYSSLE